MKLDIQEAPLVVPPGPANDLPATPEQGPAVLNVAAGAAPPVIPQMPLRRGAWARVGAFANLLLHETPPETKEGLPKFSGRPISVRRIDNLTLFNHLGNAAIQGSLHWP